MNELSIVSNIKPAELHFNLDELKEELDKRLGEYKNLIVTEDSLKGAKHAKQELASLRVCLETFRKNNKKEAEKPIKEFEEKCRELQKLIMKVETPLAVAIGEFDEKAKEEKKLYAQKIIEEAIRRYKLTEKFAAKMLLRTEYTNLSATKKAVKENVEQQARLLRLQQDALDKDKNTITTYLINENSRLKIQINPTPYLDMVEKGDELDAIISLIKKQADDIFEQENKPQNSMPVILPASSLTYSNSVKTPAYADSDITNQNPALMIPDEFQEKNDCTPHSKKVAFEVVFKLTGDFLELREINEYIKTKGVKIEVISQVKA